MEGGRIADQPLWNQRLHKPFRVSGFQRFVEEYDNRPWPQRVRKEAFLVSGLEYLTEYLVTVVVETQLLHDYPASVLSLHPFARAGFLEYVQSDDAQ